MNNESTDFGMDAMVHLFEQSRWKPQVENGLAFFYPTDQDFHAVFLPGKRQGFDWVLSGSYPLVSVPKSPQLSRFILQYRGYPGLTVELKDAGSGLVDLNCYASFPAHNLDVAELDDLFTAVFIGARELADQVIGRFGGKWKQEEE